MSTCGIYKITSPSNRIYIGQSVNIEKRFRNYRNHNCVRQKRLFMSLNKYGHEKHFFEILEECSKDLLNIKERYWQDYYNVLSKSGLNSVLNNDEEKHRVYSDETRIAMSNNAKKRKHSLSTRLKMSISQSKRVRKVGYNHSDETKQKMSDTHKRNMTQDKKERIGYNTKNMSDTTRKKISDARIGFVFSKESRLKISESNSKVIILNLLTGIYYMGYKSASDSISMKRTTLSEQLHGRNRNKTNFVIV